MIQSCDVGSLPLKGELGKFSAETAYFEERIVEGFIDKAKAGIDIPNYPQFRDMNEMFLELINGIEKTNLGYVAKEDISLSRAEIPEVVALERRSKEIYERIGEPYRLRICVTGPYTLYSLFPYRWGELLAQLGDAVSKIVRESMFSNKYGRVELVAVDEPILGLVDDPELDYGSEGRELLLKAWEDIFHNAKSKRAKTCLHLHSTSNAMFWDVKSLDIIEAPVEDSLYQSKRTKELLEKKDKFLKASIGKTSFDELIIESIPVEGKTNAGEEVSRIWEEISRGKVDPASFLESTEAMRKRLVKIVDFFGEERVPYAGLECGLRSFPTYELAMEYLRRSSEAVHSL